MALRVLGVDPGSRKTGYGIVESRGNSLVHLDNGVIVINPKDAFPLRLRQIYEGLTDAIETYKPTAMAVESIFFGKNAASALKLGQARGVALLAGANANIPVSEYSPLEVKRAVSGRGRADKRQVQEMVRMILGLPEIAQEDASDALAVAICRCMFKDLPSVGKGSGGLR